jgi:hypothetical protein
VVLSSITLEISTARRTCGPNAGEIGVVDRCGPIAGNSDNAPADLATIHQLAGIHGDAGVAAVNDTVIVDGRAAIGIERDARSTAFYGAAEDIVHGDGRGP